jgi:hypothetical protein
MLASSHPHFNSKPQPEEVGIFNIYDDDLVLKIDHDLFIETFLKPSNHQPRRKYKTSIWNQ